MYFGTRRPLVVFFVHVIVYITEVFGGLVCVQSRDNPPLKPQSSNRENIVSVKDIFLRTNRLNVLLNPLAGTIDLAGQTVAVSQTGRITDVNF